MKSGAMSLGGCTRYASGAWPERPGPKDQERE